MVTKSFTVELTSFRRVYATPGANAGHPPKSVRELHDTTEVGPHRQCGVSSPDSLST